MDKDGYVDEVALARLARSDRLNLTTFTPHKFQQLCVLSGCDYLPSLRGIGPLKAAAALNRHRDAMHVRSHHMSPAPPPLAPQLERVVYIPVPHVGPCVCAYRR